MPSTGKRGQKKFRDTDGCDIREAMFARHWVRLKGDSARAAREAGYHGDLKKRAHHLLHRPHVGRAIRRITAEAMAKLGLKTEYVVHEISCIAFADIRKLFDEDGHPLKMNELDEDIARAVSSVTQEGDKYTVALWSKIKALALLSMWLRMNPEPIPPQESLVKVHFLTPGRNENELETNNETPR